MLDPFVTAQFLGVISSTLNGESVVKGRSIFRERLGEQVAASVVTLVDDPTNPDTYAATDVDGEGLAARRNALIEDGVLQQFVHSSYSARRRHRLDRQRERGAGTPAHPASVASRCSCSRAPRDQAALIADVDDGLLVQSVSGLHSGVNSISGDFSTGASGMLITNGTVGARSASSRSPRRSNACCSTSPRSAPTSTGCRSRAGVSLVIHDITMSGV